jgi:hypothetical protein
MPQRAGHDRGQGEHAFGPVDGNPLGDRAAEGSPYDVRGVDIMPVEHREGVGGHVRQGVGLLIEIYAAGPPCIAVVEPDHLPTPGDKRTDQLVGPPDSLGRGSHNQQDSR